MNAYSFLPVDELIQPLPVSPHLLRAKADLKVQSFRESKPPLKKKPGSPATQLPAIRPAHEIIKSPSEKHIQPIAKQKAKRLAFSVMEPRTAGHSMKRRKMFVSMDEVLATSLKKKTTNAAIRTLTQEEEQDPKKILLYDEQPYNRKRAAKRLCEMITLEVRGEHAPKTQQVLDKSGESSESSSENEEAEIEFPNMKSDDFKKHFHEEINLGDKLDVVKRLAQEYMDAQRAKMVSFRDLPDEFEPSNPIAAESQLISTNKSVDKSRHAVGEWTELIESENPQNPLRLNRIAFLNKELTSKVPGLRAAIKPLEALGIAEFKAALEARKSAEAAEEGPTKELFSFRRIALPDFGFKPLQALNLLTYMSKLSDLRVVDLANNPQIGDMAGPALIYLLSHTAPLVSKLVLANTGLGLNSAFAIKDMLNNHSMKLRTLIVGSNHFGEAGLCHISMALIFNKYAQIVDLSHNQGDTAAAVAFSKMIRMNRFCKALNISGNSLPAAVFRELCRSLIVNSSLQHFSLKSTGLDDVAMKELAHSLNSNRALQVVMLNNNSVTSKGLQMIRAVLPSHPTLSHVGLSGNVDISITDLEELRTSLSKKVDIEIIKEEDFSKTSEYQTLGLDKLLKS